MDDIAPVTLDSQLSLQPGDVVVLYTDGLTEAMAAGREQFGLGRVTQLVEALRDRTAQEICDGLFAGVQAFAAAQDDDITVVVVRYLGGA